MKLKPESLGRRWFDLVVSKKERALISAGDCKFNAIKALTTFFFFSSFDLSLSTQVSVRSSNKEIMKEEEEKVTLKCISWWCTKLTKIHHHQQHCYLWLPILLFIHFYCKFLGAVHNSLIGNKQIWKMKSVWWECTWQHEDKTTRAAIAMGNHIGGKVKTERSRRLPGH